MKKIDAYIEKSAPFAQPVLTHLRALVHKACPHVEETVKWGMPHFETYGSILCHMGAFKEHCAFGFKKGSLLQDEEGILQPQAAMGHLGKITSVKDLPSDKVLMAYIREADQLNKDNVKVPATPPAAKKELVTPDELQSALKKNKAAQKTFEAFSYSCKKEYIEWITEAKTEATREKRVNTAVEWIAEGKERHWKYKK
jgi:uncharacterized protein YdeI (YjbR/CyaY-like superfamily)